MTRQRTRQLNIFLAVVAVAATIGLGLALVDSRAEAGRFAGWHGGWSQDKGGRHLGRLCSERRDERIEGMVAMVESFSDFTPDQTEAWNNLTDALRSGSTSIGDACDEFRNAGRPNTAPERLARIETMMATGLAVVRHVRPAFEEFYGVLDDKQKEALDGLISHGHRH